MTKASEGISAYPLSWPAGWERTKGRRTYGHFKRSLDGARRFLSLEIGRMGGRDVIISTDLPLRRDGMPYATGVAKSGDPGVAVYFKHKGKDMVFACDKYQHIQDNMTGIAKTIEALRGIERWGASDMMERAFAGFKRLPAGGQSAQGWREVLGIQKDAIINYNEAQQAYRVKVKETHPDYGGDASAFQAVNEAWEAARKELQ